MGRGHHNFGLIGVRHQVHGSSHSLEDLPRNHVIGQVAISTDLQSPDVRQFRLKPQTMDERTPNIDTSTCPPRIMPKDSLLSKVAAPGIRVTVSFPALTMSLKGQVSAPTQLRSGSGSLRIDFILSGIGTLQNAFSTLGNVEWAMEVDLPSLKLHFVTESKP